MTRPTYADWRAEKMAEVQLIGLRDGRAVAYVGAELSAAFSKCLNPPTPHRGECAPERAAAEPARRGTTPIDPEAPAGPFPTTAGRKVAQPNYQALGLGSAEEAEGRN